MAKLVGLFVLFCLSVAQAKSLQLELYTQLHLPVKTDLGKEPLGGLSALTWDGTKLTAVSDDRGKFGAARFYEFDLKIVATEKSTSVEMPILKNYYFKNISKDWVLDLEGMVTLPNGDLLFSSEGDNNKKPRAMPRLFVTSNTGVFKSEIPIPTKFLPNLAGLQTKGIENNRGFEGLTTDPLGQQMFVVNEYPMVTDQGDDENRFWVRLVEFKKGPASFEPQAEYAYSFTRAEKNALGGEVYRGVAEILFSGDRQLIVLERGVRLTTRGFAYTGGLYLAELKGAKNVSEIKNLATVKPAAMKKEVLIDFESVLKNQTIENYEGLAWGPQLPDGRKSLLVLSDNNFSSKEKTVLLVFAVKEVE